MRTQHPRTETWLNEGRHAGFCDVRFSVASEGSFSHCSQLSANLSVSLCALSRHVEKFHASICVSPYQIVRMCDRPKPQRLQMGACQGRTICFVNDIMIRVSALANSCSSVVAP